MEQLGCCEIRQMLLACADRIIRNEPYLTRVDSAIGDGDHGIGMKNGMQAARRYLETAENEQNVEALGVTVSAAHFNHRLRGAESDRDEAFVRKLCDDWGVPLAAASGDAAARARETGESLEEAARNLRYTFFASLGQAVATAHTADDNLETMLLNFLRGTGLTGLGGIPPKRDFLVRPILCCTRQEVLAYLDAHRLPHVEDSTNAADDCVRNRLRHNVLPLLKAENPALAETALRTAQLLRQDDAFLDCLAETALQTASAGTMAWRCDALRAEPDAVRTRAVRAMLQTIHIPKLSHAHIEAVDRLLFTDDPSASPSPAAGKRGGNMTGSASRARRTQPHSCPFRSYPGRPSAFRSLG